jgi:uncharacterized membrane protein
MDEWRLVGIVVIVTGILLGFRVAIVVVAAGIATGLAAGMPVVDAGPTPGILSLLGQAFADNRLITLFVLSLPAVGVAERYGLQERAGGLIARVRAATVGRLQLVYQLFRIGVVALGIRLGSGHVTFSRPLIIPMALGAAGIADRPGAKPDGPPDEAVERIKAASGASENYANFFGQNLFFAAAGVVLIVQGLKDNGYAVDPVTISLYSVPIVLASVGVASVQYRWLDRWLRKRQEGRDRQEGQEGPPSRNALRRDFGETDGGAGL